MPSAAIHTVARYAARYVRLLHRGCTIKPTRGGTLLSCLCIATGSFCALFLSGCVGATRLPSRTNGPAGATIQKNDIDLTFLRAGTTRREEVVNKLSQIDTGYSNSRLFWGRWSESKWAYWGVVTSAEGGRIWRVHNLLVGFDENGVMQTRELIGDGKVLDHELRAQLAKGPPLDLSQPVPITQTAGLDAIGEPFPPIDITLNKEWMQLRGPHAKSPTFKISPLKVARISFMRSDPGSICHRLYLTDETPMGKDIFICLSATDLATIIKYLQETGPPNMRWE